VTKEERARNDEQMYAAVDEYLERLLGPQAELESLTLEQEPEKEGHVG